ncbi:hypothetical protein CEXT_215281 [Caerostris extrusa]|uniref:Uncharacterized protein n=1 Tax=Caerostris extrusa TaxID=172846 RepID=A0AAV4WPG2_CAEEX|nr:hypothetical protein CEXT_215281 [Caerostris extrusa]
MLCTKLRSVFTNRTFFKSDKSHAFQMISMLCYDTFSKKACDLVNKPSLTLTRALSHWLRASDVTDMGGPNYVTRIVHIM